MELALKDSGKGDACVAIQAAKRHLWKLLQWLCNRIDEIQEMWNRADQMMAQDKCPFLKSIVFIYISLFP